MIAKLVRRFFGDKEMGDVRECFSKFGLLVHDKPGHLAHNKAVERVQFLQEELNELVDAFMVHDLDGQADALIDLVYVAKGTAVMMGLPWEKLWDDVQRANMSKVRGVGKRGHKVDLVKPPGWQGPHTGHILQVAGYVEEEWLTPMGELKHRVGRDDVHGE